MMELLPKMERKRQTEGGTGDTVIKNGEVKHVGEVALGRQTACLTS